MDAPASGAHGSLVRRRATFVCCFSKHFLRAASSRDSRGPRIPSRDRVSIIREYFPPPCGQSGSYSLRELRGLAAVSSESQRQIGPVSSAKGRAKKEAAAPHRHRSLRAARASPEAESAT